MVTRQLCWETLKAHLVVFKPPYERFILTNHLLKPPTLWLPTCRHQLFYSESLQGAVIWSAQVLLSGRARSYVRTAVRGIHHWNSLMRAALHNTCYGRFSSYKNPITHHITWSALKDLKHLHACMQPTGGGLESPLPVSIHSSLCFGLIGSVAFSIFFVFFLFSLSQPPSSKWLSNYTDCADAQKEEMALEYWVLKLSWR